MPSVITISGKVKKFGENNYRHVMFKIPDHTKEIFKKYEIEIVEYHTLIPDNIGIFVVDELQNDIVTKLINVKVEDSFKKAFEEIYNELKEKEEIKGENNEVNQTII